MRPVLKSQQKVQHQIFIGIDLSDPFAKNKRPCTRAILSDQLYLSLDEWEYREDGVGIVPPDINQSFILAIDGPQGLAGNPDQVMRISERRLAAAAKSTYNLPTPGKPFAGFVRGSVLLFRRLSQTQGLSLCGICEGNKSLWNLIEVYPGAAWPLVTGNRHMPKKATRPGRELRYLYLKKLGVEFTSQFKDGLPTHDHLDAALAAYIGYLFSKGKTVKIGEAPVDDLETHIMREGFIIQPIVNL